MFTYSPFPTDAILTFLIKVKGNLTHWGRQTHVCVSKLTTTGSDNGLFDCAIGNKHQWNLNKNIIFSFKKLHLKMSSAKWPPFCLGLNMLNTHSKATTPAMAPLLCRALVKSTGLNLWVYQPLCVTGHSAAPQAIYWSCYFVSLWLIAGRCHILWVLSSCEMPLCWTKFLHLF